MFKVINEISLIENKKPIHIAIIIENIIKNINIYPDYKINKDRLKILYSKCNKNICNLIKFAKNVQLKNISKEQLKNIIECTK